MEVAVISSQRDDWSQIEDAVARKRVQNRLAQRSHRQKYGRAPKSKKSASSKTRNVTRSPSSATSSSPGARSETQRAGGDRVPQHTAPETVGAHDEIDFSFLDSVQFQPETSGESTIYPSSAENESNKSLMLPSSSSLMTINTPVNIYPSPLTDNHFLLITTLSTLSALLTNASLLLIPCGIPIRQPSIYILPPSLSIPRSLLPTALQKTIPHWPYVDLIPFPSFRDKMMQARDVIEGQEIWNDLVEGVKVWGNSPWEERGWELSEGFVGKWWWLLDEECLGSTNFWRVARGEGVLRLGDVKGRLGRVDVRVGELEVV